MEKIVLVTGGFDPLHSGHLAYLKAASKLGDKLIVGINSDEWLIRKKGKNFLPEQERHEILSSIRFVDGCILFNDNDDTAIEAIKNVKMLFPFAQIIFANGGDRTSDNIPEMVFEDVEFVFGVGGEDKKNSSSWILKDMSKVIKPKWGWYQVLSKKRKKNHKVKYLYIELNKSLSKPKHFKRSAYWFVLEGELYLDLVINDIAMSVTLEKGDCLSH